MDPVCSSNTKNPAVNEVMKPPEVLEETSVNCPLCGLKRRYSVHVCDKNRDYPPKGEYAITQTD